MKTLTCPECKNEVDLTKFSKVDPVKLEERNGIKIGQIIECNSCGITLEITQDEGDRLDAEIVDEGK
mgnify:CR=1 FL=1